MEQAHPAKVLGPDAEWARDVDKGAAVWVVRLPRARAGNACVHSAVSGSFTWPDSPATR